MVIQSNTLVLCHRVILYKNARPCKTFKSCNTTAECSTLHSSSAQFLLLTWFSITVWWLQHKWPIILPLLCRTTPTFLLAHSQKLSDRTQHFWQLQNTSHQQTSSALPSTPTTTLAPPHPPAPAQAHLTPAAPPSAPQNHPRTPVKSTAKKYSTSAT